MGFSETVDHFSYHCVSIMLVFVCTNKTKRFEYTLSPQQDGRHSSRLEYRHYPKLCFLWCQYIFGSTNLEVHSREETTYIFILFIFFRNLLKFERHQPRGRTQLLTQTVLFTVRNCIMDSYDISRLHHVLLQLS